MHKLYKITNKVNGKLYIGITKLTLDQRWQQHCRDATNAKYPIHRAIDKYGTENFTIEVIQESEDRKFISSLEESTILQFNSRENGYNVATGGYGGDLGPLANAKRKSTVAARTDIQKQELSKKLSKIRTGKKRSEALKAKMSALQKERGGYGPSVQTPETRRKISKSNTGKVRSQEFRQRNSEIAKLRGTGPQLQGKKVSCLCCNREWDLGNFVQHLKRNKK
ncbi:grpIintron_endo, group I intron endonuclease [uncultured Caudovirales phage]|uniref:GrpIintron_endo, group I intron endonuclease n=1 Tax=uncultured Caudovirales phage TaxID=2100421 RepID=A0A6J5LEK0_9CAUD|nr:grpIintron_endo, group I intron endonuclease [uncultured Caudovirales phage]